MALARALACRPKLALLDEPLAAQDAGARAAVRDVLRAAVAELGCPAVVVTHAPEDARALGGPMVVLEAGRVVQRGTLDELAAAPATPYVARLVASERDE